MKNKDKKPKSLASGRPGITQGHSKARISAKVGRGIIRTHHQLRKALGQAKNSGDSVKAAELARRIDAHGGIAGYQHASLLGQSMERGGDSSRVLVDWLKHRCKDRVLPMRLLEVGSLSTSNAVSAWSSMEVTRIDLNSQANGILQQDFMERPLPASDGDLFDVISLSLVLNFVATNEGRGDMLRRTCKFLKAGGTDDQTLPCLFTVLPAPCILNSRYMTEERFNALMISLGYVLLEHKTTAKLVYHLWRYEGSSRKESQRVNFNKAEVNPGKTRNNFAIVL